MDKSTVHDELMALRALQAEIKWRALPWWVRVWEWLKP
jgi:hypothetical protein